jgi:hypothetical protein
MIADKVFFGFIFEMTPFNLGNNKDIMPKYFFATTKTD